MTKPLTKSIFMAGLLAPAIASGALAFGHGMRGHGACGHGALLGGARMLHALDLSADQKQKVQDILTAHQTSLAPLAAKERAASPTSCSARRMSMRWCSRNRRLVPP